MTKILLQKFKENILYFIVFVTGACVLIIEVLATRILAPFFGTTIYSVSSILGIILAGLSLGYYFGGKTADKNPDPKIFYLIIFSSGATVLLVQLMKVELLPRLINSFNIKSGPVFFSMLLFLIPAFLLGMLSPFAIKLQEGKENNTGIGTISGKVFFASTVGSIIGSFIAGFYLIPNFGIDLILTTIGILLGFIGLLGIYGKAKLNIIAKLTALIIGIFFINISLLDHRGADVVFSHDGVYQQINIVKTSIEQRPAKMLMLDANPSAAKFINYDDMAFAYAKYYEIYKHFNKDARSFLSLGGGGYIVPHAIANESPDARIDVVELEPRLYSIAQEQFDLQNKKNINNYIRDGRTFLRSSDKYDVIFSDVYLSLYSIPVHMTTKEFFQLNHDRLNEQGVFIANIIGMLDDDSPVFALSEYKTFSRVFDNNYVFAVDDPSSYSSQNLIFVGFKSDSKIEFENERIGDNDEILLSDHLVDMSNYNLEDQLVLTDNYAPVESLNISMLEEIKE